MSGGIALTTLHFVADAGSIEQGFGVEFGCVYEAKDMAARHWGNQP